VLKEARRAREVQEVMVELVVGGDPKISRIAEGMEIKVRLVLQVQRVQ